MLAADGAIRYPSYNALAPEISSVCVSGWQHSVDYWLFADLLLPESRRLVKSVIRVRERLEADVFFIPLFSTISFFLLDKPECKRLYRVCVRNSCFPGALDAATLNRLVLVNIHVQYGGFFLNRMP